MTVGKGLAQLDSNFAANYRHSYVKVNDPVSVSLAVGVSRSGSWISVEGIQ